MSDYLRINGVRVPTPSKGMQIISSTVVDSGRNINGAVIGQVVGRKLWKINNLQWVGLTAAQWQSIRNALSNYFIPVTFYADDGRQHTITMYPSDLSAEPLELDSTGKIVKYKVCSFNLIDCGW